MDTHPGDGALEPADLLMVTLAPVTRFDWHEWAATKTAQQAGDMMAALAYRLRCEAENNTVLGRLLTEATGGH